MPANNKTVYAVWKANDDVMYYVEHYLQEVRYNKESDSR